MNTLTTIVVGTVLFNCCYNNLHLNNWTPFETFLTYRIYNFLQKIIHHGLCPPLKNKLTTKMNVSYNLRNFDDMAVKRFHNNTGQKSLEHWAPKMWNSLPHALKQNQSIRIFNMNLKKHINWYNIQMQLLPFYIYINLILLLFPARSARYSQDWTKIEPR